MKKTCAGVSFAMLFVSATFITRTPVSKSLWKRPALGRKVSEVARQRLVETYARLPLSFEANQGQTDRSVQFLSRGTGYTLFLTANEAVLSLRKAEPRLSRAKSREQSKEPQGSGGLYPSRARQQAINPQITPISPIVIPRSVSDEGSALSSPSAPSVKSVDDAVLRLKLVGANPAPEVIGLDELPGKSNYFYAGSALPYSTFLGGTDLAALLWEFPVC